MEKIKRSELWGYSIGTVGGNLVYALMGSFLTLYLTDVLGIGGTFVGLMVMFSKVFDAVNDFAMAIIIDKTNTRWGKFRPLILFGAIGGGLLLFTNFFSFGLSGVALLVYVTLAYNLFWMAYTVRDVSYWSMLPTLTTDPDERTRVAALPRIMGMIGALVAGAGTMPLIKALGGGDDQKGYLIVALIYGAAYIVMFTITFFKTKEKAKAQDEEREKVKLKTYFKVIATNKPLIIVTLASFFSSIPLLMRATVGLYFFKYNIGNESLYGIYSLVGMIGMIGVMAVSSKIGEKLGKRKAAIYANVIGILGSLIILINTNSIPVILISAFVGMGGLGLFTVITTSMTADTVEYGEWKTGKRSESMIFSTTTFLAKVTAGVATALVGFSLDIMGFIPNVAQTETTLNGFILLMSAVPAIGTLIGTIFLFKYDLSKDKFEEITKELKQRNS